MTTRHAEVRKTSRKQWNLDRLPTEGAPSKILEKNGSYWVNSMKNPSILFPLCWLHKSAHGPRFWVAISVIRPTKLEHAGEVSEKF